MISGGDGGLATGGALGQQRLLPNGSRPFCELEPHSVRVERLMAQFHEGVLPYVELECRWRSDIIRLLIAEDEQPNDAEQIKRLDRALRNLRKQHLWSDIPMKSIAISAIG